MREHNQHNPAYDASTAQKQTAHKAHVAAMQVQSAVDVDKPLFQPFPSEILFHSYEPFKEYEAVLRLRNNDKVGGARRKVTTAMA